MNILVASLSYFALVFGAGFIFGTIRVLVVAPLIGDPVAEVLELPLMLFVTWMVARYIVSRFRIDRPVQALGAGLFALALMLIFEFTIVLRLRDLTIEQYLASRDPAVFTAYLASLFIFGLMPLLALLFTRRQTTD